MLMGRISEAFTQVGAEQFLAYLVKPKGLPPLDPRKLEASLIEGEQRDKKIIPITGDATIYLNYKNRPGAVVSFGVSEGDLSVFQLQGGRGSRSEGFRVTTGMLWVAFFADQINLIGQKSEGMQRITMAPAVLIEGIIDASESALIRYQAFAKRLNMSYSAEEQLHVLDLK